MLWIVGGSGHGLAESSVVTLDFTAEPKIATFESPISPALAASIEASAGKVSLSTTTVKQARASLRWDWQAGDAIRFKIPPFDSKRATGPYASWRPCVQFWIFSENDEVSPLLLTSDSLSTKPLPSVPIAINHAGSWRRSIVSYYYDMKLGLDMVPSHVVLTAPAAGHGTLYFDLTSFDMQFPNGDWVKPGDVEKSTAASRELYAKVVDRFQVTQSNSPDPKELAKVKKIRDEFIRGGKPAPKDPPKEAAAMAAQVDQFIKQSWLARNRIDAYVTNDVKSSYTVPGEKVLNDINARIKMVAELYETLERGSPPFAQLEQMILKLVDFGEFQLGREFIIDPLVLVKIREILITNKIFDRYVIRAISSKEDFFKRLIAPDKIRLQGNIEDLGWGGGSFPSYLNAIYMLADDQQIALAMRALKEGINHAIFPASSAGGYLDDGTVNHHGVPNWAYGAYCMPGFYDQLGNTYTRFDFLEADRLAYMQRVLMRSEAFSAGLEVPFAVRARWLEHASSISPKAFKCFALHGNLDGSVNREAAGAYLNMVPKDANTEPFVSLGIKPRAVPAQTFTMPWSCLLVHRDDGYLVTLKGFNTTVAAFEMQGSNRLARYLSHGLLQISNNPRGGDQISFAESGFSFNGLDWNHLPGTTSKPLPDEQLHRNLGRARGTEAFAGGLATSSRHAVFGMKLHDVVDQSFVARKSYFFFGDRIICLGSDIHSDDAEFPIHTTLFQKHLKTPDQVIYQNGVAVSKFPYQDDQLSVAETNWLMDPHGIGYIVPSGQHISVRRSHQTSHAASCGDQTLGPSNEADYAVAWIDHGKAPINAGYEYAILINRPLDAVKTFSNQLSDKEKSPYVVMQKNNSAHIVRDVETDATGYAIFEANRPLADSSFIMTACNPVLAMHHQDGKNIRLTLCDPVLHYQPNIYPNEYVPVSTTILVRGGWNVRKLPASVTVKAVEKDTEISFLSCNATEIELELVPR